MKKGPRICLPVLLLLAPAAPAFAQTTSGVAFTDPAASVVSSVSEDGRGTSGVIRLQQTIRRDQRPPMDPVGGFQISVFGGVQLRGTASGQFGVALGWYKRSTGNIGVEFEGGYTQGPTGRVYHGLVTGIFQSSARAARMVPYLALGAGVFRAEEKLQDAVRDALPTFGITPQENSESGPLLAFGFGVRYFFSEKVSFRADYREFRALTSGDTGFFDRLYALRRIAGFLSLRF